MKNINVLYLSYDGMTDSLGQSQVLPYLVGLSKSYSIHILSCEKPIHFSKNKETIEKICFENDIHWHPISYHKDPPIVSTLHDYRNMLNTAKSLHRKYKFSIVHCRSYLPAMVGLYLKKKYGVKFLFDMRGFWADERKDAGLWNTSNPIYNAIYQFFKRKEKQFFTQADYVVSLTQAGKEEIESWNLPNSAPIQVIPCCADFELFNYHNLSNHQISQQKIDLGISKDALVLTYLGSIGTWYMLDEMLAFFVELKTLYKNAIFHFITRETPETIHEKAQRVGLATTDFVIAPANRTEVPLRLAISDISIFFIKNYYSKKASSPTKQAEIMGMGLPLICNAGIGDVDNIIENTHSGLLIHQCNAEEYLSAVRKVPKLLSLSKEHIRQAGMMRFSLKDGVNHYLSIYKSILHS